jgi:hypothetical protein
MRCILGFCVALATGISSWAANTGAVASEAEFQVPAVTAGTPVVQPPATNTIQAAAASVYQGATAQPATTPALPATNMMPGGTYTAPMQPTTTYAAPGTSMTYPAYTYRAGSSGTVYRTMAPVYTTTATPATTTYGTPVQGYTTMPAQTTYAPVRRRFPFGLFQRWRQQATPTYTTMPGYASPMYTYPSYTSAPRYTTGIFMNRGVWAGNYVMGGYTSPVYSGTTYTVPSGTMPAGMVTNTVAPTTTAAQPMAPVYTPTTLTVPNTPASAGAPTTGTAPANSPGEDAQPIPNVPTPTDATQGAGAAPARSIPPPPPIPSPAATGTTPK